MNTTTAKLPEAATVDVEIEVDDAAGNSNVKSGTLDVYILLDLIIEGETDHGETGIERLYPLRDAVAKKLDVQFGQIAINQVLDLREHVVTMTNRLDKERKKKFLPTAGLPVSTQDFPVVSDLGPSEKKTPGLETPPKSNGGG